MTMREEMLKAQADGNEYIPPFKLNEMVKLAGKVVKLLTDNCSAVTFSYSDIKIVMRMVDNVLAEHIQTPSDCTIHAADDAIHTQPKTEKKGANHDST